MIIAGDFNAKWNESYLYPSSYLSKHRNLSAVDLEMYTYYSVGIHKHLEKFGWTSAYTPETLVGGGGTTKWGPLVDWVYLSPDFSELTELVPRDAMVLPGLVESDHNAVQVIFARAGAG